MNKQMNDKTALVCAVDILAIRPHSKKQLYDKLKKRGYLDEEINYALQRLIDRHYLDDADLCERQFNAYLNEKRCSITAIKYKLLKKGFNDNDIKNVILQNDIDIIEYEYQVCLKLLTGHFKQLTAQKQKCQAYLYRKGFSSSSIRLAVEDFLQ